MIELIAFGATLIMAAIAVYTDVRWGKIFNAVTLPGLLLGLILNSIAGGMAGLVVSVEGIAVGLGVFLVSACLGRILGGGDIKLLIAVGALQGPIFLLWTIVATAAIGAILAVVTAVYHGILIAKLRSLVATCYLRVAQKVPMQMDHDSSGPRLPYAIAIALGTIVAMAVVKL